MASSSVDRATAEAAGFGGRPAAIKVLRWRAQANPAGTVLGYADIELSSGLIVCDVRLGVGAQGRRYIMPPAEAQRDRDGRPVLDERGKQRWRAHLDFRDAATRERFQEQALAALRRVHPELFAGEPS